MTRRRATLNVFMLAGDDRLKEFVDEVARRNGGRVFSPDADRLGEYVVSDFLRRTPGRDCAQASTGLEDASIDARHVTAGQASITGR